MNQYIDSFLLTILQNNCFYNYGFLEMRNRCHVLSYQCQETVLNFNDFN